MRFSHGRVLFDSRNVQKGVTQIIYLGPLPSAYQLAVDNKLHLMLVPLPNVGHQPLGLRCTCLRDEGLGEVDVDSRAAAHLVLQGQDISVGAARLG